MGKLAGKPADVAQFYVAISASNVVEISVVTSVMSLWTGHLRATWRSSSR